MKRLLTLTRRNVQLYFIDAANVFFSLLGAIIAVLIIVLFLKNTIVDSLVADYHGLVVRSTANNLLNVWLVASACVIASGTTGLGAMRQYVADRETNRWRDFLVTPVSRWVLTLGYLLAAVTVSIIMTTAIFAVGTIVCIASGATISVAHIFQTWGWLLLCSLSFTAFFGFLTSFLKTVGSFAALSTVIGVTFGFFAETYVQAGILTSNVTNVLNALPFAQASALVRGPYCADMIAALPQTVRSGTLTFMGNTLTIGDHTVQVFVMVTVLAGMAVVFSILAWRVIATVVRRHA